MFTSTRQFKLWDYNISHRQLLLRSPQTRNTPENTDILWWGVVLISLPSVLNGLTLRVATADESTRRLSEFQFGLNHQVHVYVVETTIGDAFVIAAGCKVLTNNMDIFESSLVYFNRDRPLEEYGTVIALL
jgi:hypothetical protein